MNFVTSNISEAMPGSMFGKVLLNISHCLAILFRYLLRTLVAFLVFIKISSAPFLFTSLRKGKTNHIFKLVVTYYPTDVLSPINHPYDET
jgi:hypothetical protein